MFNGWPHSDVGPATPDPAVRALLPWNPDVPAVAVSATATTVEVWCLEVPGPAQVRAWEEAAGRIVTVMLTTPEVMAALAAARTAGTYTTGWDDLLTHIGASFGELGGQVWPRASSVTVRPGRPATLRTAAGRTVDVSGGLWTADRVAGLAADLGLSGAGRAVFTVPGGVRAVAVGRPERIHVRFKAATFPGVDKVGLPAQAAALTSGGPAVVAVGSAPGRGRTALAVALAAHAASRTGAGIATVGPAPLWWGTDGGDWVHYPQPAAAAVAAACEEGAGVLLVDDVASELASDEVWAAAGRAAAGGVTVIVTSRHAELAGLADAAHRSAAGPMLRGAVVRTLVGPEQTLTVDDTLVCTVQLRRWLAANPDADLLFARDLHGHDAGHSYDTALGLAVSAGRLDAADAADWVRDPDRYGAADRHTRELAAPPPGDWDWQTRSSV